MDDALFVSRGTDHPVRQVWLRVSSVEQLRKFSV